MPFFHGALHLEIYEARDLPRRDGLLRVSGKKTDPYCTVDISKNGSETTRLVKTLAMDDSLSPKWNEKFYVNICHDVDGLKFRIKDYDYIKTDAIGSMSISAENVHDGSVVEGWFGLRGKSRLIGPVKDAGEIRIRIQYICLQKTLAAQDAIFGNEVPRVPFPMRTGCHVRLYQDAHTPEVGPLANVRGIDGTSRYRPGNLWMDVQHAMENATKLIYIIGWSVKADLPLVRGGGEDGSEDSEDLGVLLKRKASSGVRVLLLLWDEALSTQFYPPGVIGTHDEETKQYFAGSDVEVVLAPRRKYQGKLKDQVFVTTMFTHHQKCILVDAPVGGGVEGDGSSGRKVVAFAGGVDLTDGRYDTPEHTLFKTLHTTHRRDYYNGIVKTTGTVGPREPWHDIHMYVEGPVVSDLHCNFVQRWRYQSGPNKGGRVLPLELEDFVDPPVSGGKSSLESLVSGPTFNVQMFRSIDSDSAQFDFKNLPMLHSRKGRTYDCSIQLAYIHHIRKAKRFIYMENQYFLGSSHSWLHPETKAPHLIPMELTARIIRAIEREEDFRVYIVIPLHPEGDPTSAQVQSILHWQHRTVEMMYLKIANAIASKGSSADPTDYLSLFCLGKRESPEDLPTEYLEQPPEHSVAEKLRQNLRFMIYVHSKMAIFDDEYILVGSANINERSMNGMRDTELVLGAYQPCDDGIVPYDGSGGERRPAVGKQDGDIHLFRLALWAEHCGVQTKEHFHPSTQECMTYMKDLGKGNLHKFVHDGPHRSTSHLMLYPYEVSAKGEISARADCMEFVDTGGSVLGKSIPYLPDRLTT